jgi:hypothetical protein
MKRALIIALLMLPAASFAEEKVWYCQETASTGLNWEDGKYTDINFQLERYTVKQKGSELNSPEAVERAELPSGAAPCYVFLI